MSARLASSPRKISFFLTGHGFGHGVRNSALIDALPEDVEVDIYTSLPEGFFREEIARSVRVIPCEIDCGCLQKDTVEVDVPATLARYAEIESGRDLLMEKYSTAIRESGTDLVIGDIPPLAFPIAREAGVTAWSLCNFTWVDIYRPYLESHPRYRPMLERMEKDYSSAHRSLRMFPCMTGPHGTEDVATEAVATETVGMVCRPGRSRREEFARRYGWDSAKRWCLIYVGSFGLDGVAWERLSDYSDWEFIGLYDLPGAPSNYHHIRKDLGFRYADLTASVDLVLGKLGYGLVTECLALGKPVFFLGRRDFAEYNLLKELVETRLSGVEIPLDRFLAMDLAVPLQRLNSSSIQGFPASGVGDILQKLGFSTQSS